MLIDFIKIASDQSPATEAAELLTFIRTLRTAYELGIRIRATMRHNFNDTVNPIDWSGLETLWGVPTGKGADVFTYVDGAVGSMEGAFQGDAAKVITERVG